MDIEAEQLEESAVLNTLARSGSAALFGLVVSAILTFAFTVIVTHELGPKTAGALFEAIAIFTIAASCATLGSDVGLLRFLPGLYASRKEAVPKQIVVALIPTVIVSIIGAGLIYVYSDQLARVFVSGSELAATAHILRIFAAFIPVWSATAVILAATRIWTIGPFVWVTYIFVPLVRVLVVAESIWIGKSLLSTAVSWAAPLAVGVVWAVVVLLQRIRREKFEDLRANLFRRERKSWSSFWRFSLARSLAGTFDILLQWLDVLLVGAIAGPTKAAVYAIVSRYVSLALVPALAVGFAIAPEASRLLHLDLKDDAKKLYRTSAVWLTVIGFPILLVLAVFSPIFLSVFGEHYKTGAVALTIISLSMLINTGTGNNATLLLMAGRSSWNLLISAFSLILNVVANLVLIPKFGLTGAAEAWAISICATNALSATFLWRFVRMQPFSKPLAYAAGLSALFYGAGGIIIRIVFGDRLVITAASLIVVTALYSVGIYLRRTSLDLHNFGALVRRQ
jgi:O-antigen/teichoic acid export membrane protein